MLRRYWPPEGQILLLVAALADLETARQAWRQWNAEQALADASWPEVCLLAAVARRAMDLAPGTPLDARLAGARRHIWTRTQMTLAAVRPLLATLRGEGLRLMLIKGAARLANDPALAQGRTLRDIDVLVHPQDWERSLGIAKGEGWIATRNDSALANLRRRPAINLRKPRARGECDLHRYVLRECANEGQDLDLWDRALPVRFLGVDVLCPAPTDFALVTLAQSMFYDPAPAAPYWALDIDPLIRAGKIDWDLLLREVRHRQIQPYVAAPLSMLLERIGSPVPGNVLRDLTERVSRHCWVEFETRATGLGPGLPEQGDAKRIMTSARAMRVARKYPQNTPAHGQISPMSVRHQQLKPNEQVAIPVPVGAAPFSRLRLYLSFDVHRARSHAYLHIEGSGLPLKIIPVERASRARGGRVRRQVVVLCPSCLFTLRGVQEVRVRTNKRLRIRNIVMSWGRPANQAPLARWAAVFRRWRDRLRRSSAD
jgi:hypothetical protein